MFGNSILSCSCPKCSSLQLLYTVEQVDGTNLLFNYTRKPSTIFTDLLCILLTAGCSQYTGLFTCTVADSQVVCFQKEVCAVNF